MIIFRAALRPRRNWPLAFDSTQPKKISTCTFFRRRKLANFLAHAHHLEKRVARSFAYHIDACERAGRDAIAQIVARAKTDEDGHVRYTRATVFDLLTRREARGVMEVHRRAEARANLLFSQRQVRLFLARFGTGTSRHRQWLFRICATIMEAAGQYA